MTDDPLELVVVRRAEAVRKGVLDMWTIYDKPADFPDRHVARRFVFDAPTDDMIAGSLIDMRQCFLEAGLYCMPRAEADEPQIVEVWL